jgi:hypothetical protein
VSAVDPFVESCIPPPAPSLPTQCFYTLHVTTDYVVSALPAQIQCSVRSQVPVFPLESDIEELSALSALVIISPRTAAQFKPNETTLTALVDCFLQVPQSGGGFRTLDSDDGEVLLPGPP